MRKKEYLKIVRVVLQVEKLKMCGMNFMRAKHFWLEAYGGKGWTKNIAQKHKLEVSSLYKMQDATTFSMTL